MLIWTRQNTDLDPNVPTSQVTGVHIPPTLNVSELTGPWATFPQETSFSLLHRDYSHQKRGHCTRAIILLPP